MIDRPVALRIPLDPCNPGQYFACCGFLELADRLWEGAEGWFDESALCLAPIKEGAKPADLLSALAAAPLTAFAPADPATTPLILGGGFDLRLDWWNDDRAGGSRFKTWAGRQTIVQIADAMKQPLSAWADLPAREWLTKTGGDGLPFNFDAALGAQSSAIDVGFSLDPLKMSSQCRPLLEFVALVGLQRFRPAVLEGPNRYAYSLWSYPLLPQVAAVASHELLGPEHLRTYEFSLLFRTKYLKSFLPATLQRGDA